MGELSKEQARSDCDPVSGSEGDLQLALFRVLRSLVFRSDPSRTELDELPITQIRCLYVVHKEQGLRMADVSARLEMKLPAISQVVDRLVKRGMIERRTDDLDRRVIRLFLTDSAITILADAEAARQVRLASTAAKLDVDSMRSVIHGLELLAEASERVEAEERDAAPRSLPDVDALIELIDRKGRLRPADLRPLVSPGAEVQCQK